MVVEENLDGKHFVSFPRNCRAAGFCAFFYVLMSKYWDEMHEAKKDKLVLTGIVRFLQNNGASVTSSEGSRIEG
jgi:membrane-anchored protein YejM (alkaline phosphatase superfamily)